MRTSLIFLAALLAGTHAAAAADPDLLSAPEVVIDESRAGPYLRADLFYDFATEVDGTSALALPGGVFAAPFAGAELGEAAALALGAGYRFTDMLRFDATVRYSEPDLFAGVALLPGCGTVCVSGDEAKVRNWELLANGYVDLGTFAGFTPYVGGSLGAVRASYRDPALRACSATGCSDAGAGAGASDWRFAYALSAGVAMDLTSTLSLDVGYRYLDADGGDAYRFAAGTPFPAGTGPAVADDGFERHSVRVGVRFELW